MNAKTIILAAITASVAACAPMERLGNALYRPVVGTNTVQTNVTIRVPEVVLLPDGTARTNFVDRIEPRTVNVVSTNGWTIAPGVAEAVTIAGDVAPFPWAGLASNALLAALGIGAALKGKKYKAAAISAVDAAAQFRSELRKANPEAEDEVKARVKASQKATGTKPTIETLLAKAK